MDGFGRTACHDIAHTNTLQNPIFEPFKETIRMV